MLLAIKNIYSVLFFLNIEIITAENKYLENIPKNHKKKKNYSIYLIFKNM